MVIDISLRGWEFHNQNCMQQSKCIGIIQIDYNPPTFISKNHEGVGCDGEGHAAGRIVAHEDIFPH